MKTIAPYKPETEFFIDEGCHIVELLNDHSDDACSIARARVSPGVTTKFHHLRATVERYVILEGQGRVEIGGEPPQAVAPFDVVSIPAGARQRITNTGPGDLIFLCVCTPRFRPEAYVNTESGE